MNSLRSIAVAGAIGAAALASGLLADPFGARDGVARGQNLMARTPSMLAAPSGSASSPGYRSLTSHYATPAYGAAPAFVANSARAPQPAPSPYGYTAYPTGGYRPAYAQVAPYSYQAAGTQPAWPYVQADDGQTSVLLGRSELLGGPPLAPPQVQLPAPSRSPAGPYNPTPMQQTPRPSVPMYQAPYAQPQAMPGYDPGFVGPEYAMPGYAAPGYAAPEYAAPGYAAPGCDATGYYGGGTAGDYWAGGYASAYGPPAVSNWFGSVGGLLMTRSHSDHFTFSYGTGNEADQRTDQRDASMQWGGGFDVRLGRYFNCQRNAIEAVYWGIYPASQSTQTYSGDVLGNLNGIFNWNSLDYGGAAASNYVNVAPGADGIHTLTRDYAFQNLEFNLWSFCGSCGAGPCGCSRLRTNWLVGIRYFRFDENLSFAADANDWYITHEDDEIFYNINIQNHLVGFQVGNQAQYCICDRLTASLGTKLGLYGNRINHMSEIGGNLGTATINNGPFAGREFYVNNSKNDVAFLGEVNLGLQYCFTCRWTGTIGYRALALTGVALPADQIYPDLRGINDVENIGSSRALILHGGYAGLQYNW